MPILSGKKPQRLAPRGLCLYSGIDALRVVSEGVNRAKVANDMGILLITHYTRILRYIEPDHVHVFVDGRIVEQGGPELADELEANGYDRYLAQA